MEIYEGTELLVVHDEVLLTGQYHILVYMNAGTGNRCLLVVK